MKKNINVIHSFPVWLPQTQTWMYHQVKFLPNDIVNHIVCEKTENIDQFGLPNIHCLAEMGFVERNLDNFLRTIRVRRHLNFLVKNARQTGCQIIHSHFGNIGWDNLEAARMAGVKHVVTFYGQEVTRFPHRDPRWYQRYEKLFANIDLVCCEGPFMRQSVIKLGCPAEKVVVQHLGIEVERIDFKPRVLQKGEPLRVLMAATFREKKGIPYALEALGKIKDKIPLEITIIGDASSDVSSPPEKKKILKTIAQWNLQEKVRMLGYQPYEVLFSEAYRHHIFISPSVTASDGDTEGGAPVSLIDMASSGMIIVSTTHCDIPEIIENGRTGLLAQERDSDGLADYLLWLMEHPDKWAEFAHAGRKRMEKEYNAVIQGEKLANRYRDIVN